MIMWLIVNESTSKWYQNGVSHILSQIIGFVCLEEFTSVISIEAVFCLSRGNVSLSCYEDRLHPSDIQKRN